jgi:hypothetical protein
VIDGIPQRARCAGLRIISDYSEAIGWLLAEKSSIVENVSLSADSLAVRQKRVYTPLHERQSYFQTE